MSEESDNPLHAALGAQRHVSGERLQRDLAALARFGGRPDGGVSREALGPADIAGRRYLVERARELGCEVATDDCANLFFRRPGRTRAAPVMTGSHADTQPVGGRLDGAYGVIGGLEVIAALNDAGIATRRPVEVVAWTNEEGCRFSPGAMGSSAFVQPFLLADYREARDSAGTRFGDALDAARNAFPDIGRRALGIPLSAYVELHIEQGPVLERARVPLGVVTGIQGVHWYRVACSGIAAHAGTTPMEERADAMRAAVDLARQLYAAAEEAGRGLRLTLGRWEVVPNSINTIPALARFTVDARCAEEAVLDGFESRLRMLAATLPWRGETTVERFFSRQPTRFPDPMRDLVEQACRSALSAPDSAPEPLRLMSGAFHDAMYLADHCPTAMIFVPSRGGISHNAAEDTDPADLQLGVRALAYTVAELACR